MNKTDKVPCSSEVDVSMGGGGEQEINCKYNNNQVRHMFQEVI